MMNGLLNFGGPGRDSHGRGGRSRLSSFPMPLAAVRLGDYPAVTYGPPEVSFAIDFLTRLGEAYTFETLKSESIDYEGIPIRLVTPEQLYEMKRNTVRLKDKADCASLNEKFHFEES